MKVKALVVASAALLAVVCVFLLGGPLSHTLPGLGGLDDRDLAIQSASSPGRLPARGTIRDVRRHSRIQPGLLPNVSFNPGGRDSLVFIHIPKTGGSDFLRHLVTVERDGVPLCLSDAANSTSSSQSARRRKDRAVCLRPRGTSEYPGGSRGGPWLISEKTLGWYCGLHPFYSEYESCISFERNLPTGRRKFDPQATFHYSTMLRHPILRYMSEYLHVQRGATFSYRHTCGGGKVTDSEMPPCYPGFYDHQTWDNVTLSWFLSCESNWANNRQTFSVADLETVQCFRRKALPSKERERRLLESAKRNLARFAFFGITEYQAESSALFEKTFGLKFGQGLEQKPVGMLNSAPMLNSLWNTESTYNRIAATNHLDVQLYQYALDLFAARLMAMGVKIDLDHVSKAVQLLPVDSDSFQKKKFRKQSYDLDVG